MARLKTFILAGATFLSALAIGYTMQSRESTQIARINGPVTLENVEMTSATRAPQAMPADAPVPSLPSVASVGLVNETPAPVTVALPAPVPHENGSACGLDLNARPSAGAMVAVTLSAPCHASERVTLHHHGLMITERVQPDGTLSVDMPALAENATIIAEFADGAGATATATVDNLKFYDRVAVQWRGQAGLQLHAREYGSAYFQPGHVWAASGGDLAATARGEGGFLVRLGLEDNADALMAEVYTFPSGTAVRAGDVLLSVEAEVTGSNCDTSVAAQTLQRPAEGRLRVHDLDLAIPDCARVGDFLVLKNLVEDLTIAAR